MKAGTQTFVAIGATILLFSVGSLFLPAPTAQAGLWDMASTMNWETKELDASYLISVEGFDARAYEFTPTGNPNITCVFVASNKPSGVSCFPKQSYIIPFKILTN